MSHLTYLVICTTVWLSMSYRNVQACKSAEFHRTWGHLNSVSDRNCSTNYQPRVQNFTLFLRGGGQTDADKIEENQSENVQQKQVGILDGSLLNALQEARSKARLLIVFLPAMPGSLNIENGETETLSFDRVAWKSLLSDGVSSVTERTFRSNKKSSTSSSSKLGSFLIWSSPHGSSNYNSAVSMIKKLKGMSPLGSKTSPYLVVLYPAQVFDSTKTKIIPKLLAQHHCNPPPGVDSMASWLLSLRNRHKKLYASMHRDLAEMEFLRERIMGYSESIKKNRALEKREKEEEEKRLEMARLENEHLVRIQARRKFLLESLPPEPELQEEQGVITIALRFPDGKKGRRRFKEDTPFRVVFDWVDAVFDIEREKVELSTMTGQKTFALSSTNANVTLKDIGLRKLTGLYVLISG